ncbi:hypothetical protein PSPO01_03930 [Paraphaeosphaeria sporulosa]
MSAEPARRSHVRSDPGSIPPLGCSLLFCQIYPAWVRNRVWGGQPRRTRRASKQASTGTTGTLHFQLGTRGRAHIGLSKQGTARSGMGALASRRVVAAGREHGGPVKRPRCDGLAAGPSGESYAFMFVCMGGWELGSVMGVAAGLEVLFGSVPTSQARAGPLYSRRAPG